MHNLLPQTPRERRMIACLVACDAKTLQFGGLCGEDVLSVGARASCSHACSGMPFKSCRTPGLAEESKPSAAQNFKRVSREVSEGSRLNPQKGSKTSLLETLRVKNHLTFDSGDSFF